MMIRLLDLTLFPIALFIHRSQHTQQLHFTVYGRPDGEVLQSGRLDGDRLLKTLLAHPDCEAQVDNDGLPPSWIKLINERFPGAIPVASDPPAEAVPDPVAEEG